ncbi:ACADS.2 family protein [Megaselia abdita]
MQTLPRTFMRCRAPLQRFLSTTQQVVHSDVQNLCRKFTDSEIVPLAASLDRNGKYPEKTIKKLGEMGLMGMTVSKNFNGSELDYTSVSIAVEEISRGCASTGAIVSIHNILYADLLNTHGTDRQKNTFLKPYTLGRPGAFALSESDAGSDVANIQTVAQDHGSHFILNGTKSWVTSGIEADVGVIFATIDKERKHKGITAFIVPLNSHGVSKGKPEDKMGIRASSTCQITLKDVKVPAENILGEVGQGFKIAMQQLNKARLGIASQALGIAQASLEQAVLYSIERKQFGKTLSDLQAVKIRIAQVAAKVEASRLLVRKATALADKGEPFIKNAAMAKLVASETANFAAHQCVQVMGGMGFIKGMPAERFYRDARITEIYGGVTDVQMMIIAEQVLKEFA